jgi:prepilin-type N-terminal cleavage/methylation domain-containing protein
MIKGFIRRFTPSSSKGFTLIELLVVIAIIGILAGIVLASLSTARSGASDAKTKEQLSSLRTAMEIYYSQNGNYGGTAATCAAGAFATAAIAPLVASANYSNQTVTCGASNTAWAASVTLVDTSVNPAWCVDSTGNSSGGTASANNATVCP